MFTVQKPRTAGASIPLPRRDLAARLATALIALFAIAVLVHYVYDGAPDVPILDSWKWIRELQQLEADGWPAMFTAQKLVHNEHVYLLPTLVFLATGAPVGWSLRPYAFVTAALLIGFGVFFYRIARAQGLGRFEAVVAFLLPVSLRHYENLHAGFQFGIVLSVVAGTLAIEAAEPRHGARGLALAVVLGLVATLSSGIGLVALGIALCVRFVHVERPRRALAGLAVVAALPALALLALYVLPGKTPNYLARLDFALHAKSVAEVVMGWFRIVGGGLIGGIGSAAVGPLAVAAAGWMVYDDARRHRRLSGPAGIIVFSLVASVAVAWGRVFDLPASRWAIFAVPALAVTFILVARQVPTAMRESPPLRVLLAVGVCWVAAYNAIEASRYRLEVYAREIRADMVGLREGDPLLPEELARVHPGPAEFVRSNLEYYVARGLGGTVLQEGVDVHRGLPTRLAWSARVDRVDEAIEVAGPGYVFERQRCRYRSGCLVRVIADVRVTGRATLGIIVRDLHDAERNNTARSLPARDRHAIESWTATVDYGQGVDAYVFSYSAADVVNVRKFTLVMVGDPDRTMLARDAEDAAAAWSPAGAAGVPK